MGGDVVNTDLSVSTLLAALVAMWPLLVLVAAVAFVAVYQGLRR